MSDKPIGFAFKISGTGECRDSEGRLLDGDGNPEEKDEDQ